MRSSWDIPLNGHMQDLSSINQMDNMLTMEQDYVFVVFQKLSIHTTQVTEIRRKDMHGFMFY